MNTLLVVIHLIEDWLLQPTGCICHIVLFRVDFDLIIHWFGVTVQYSKTLFYAIIVSWEKVAYIDIPFGP